MGFVIGQPCIGVKDTACVDACPVDCIHAYVDSEQLYIDPAVCIDCGACEPACPVSAIFPGDQVPEDQKKFIQINIDFFASFDKSKSVVYQREGAAKKDGEATEGGGAAGAVEAKAHVTEWKETQGWESLWEAHKDDPEDRTEVQKRYGRVRAVYESSAQYVIRIYLPEKTPNHPLRYRFSLPDEMSTYDVQAEIKGTRVSVYGKIADAGLAKLCGLANSFPDSFSFEYGFDAKISSVAVQTKGTHIVDIVAAKSQRQSEAA